jgi:uncharacterized protein (DUF488 family)
MSRTIEVYSIGHSNAPFEAIAQLLQQYEIRVLVDVRSKPRSRWVPHFDKKNLESAIPKLGIEYQWAGNHLGGLPDDPTYYQPNPERRRKTDPVTVVDYVKIARQSWFQRAIDELLEVASRQRTAIMCAEENPQKCHRSQLIGHALVKKGVEVRHIRGNGVTEPQTAD